MTTTSRCRRGRSGARPSCRAAARPPAAVPGRGNGRVQTPMSMRRSARARIGASAAGAAKVGRQGGRPGARRGGRRCSGGCGRRRGPRRGSGAERQPGERGTGAAEELTALQALAKRRRNAGGAPVTSRRNRARNLGTDAHPHSIDRHSWTEGGLSGPTVSARHNTPVAPRALDRERGTCARSG